MSVEFAVLGPVAVRNDGRDLPLGGPKQRAVLAILLLDANKVVSRDRLIDGLWGESPPATAAHTLDNYISRLRKSLGEGRVLRRPPGYLLHVENEELDLDRFERLLDDGRRRFSDGDAADAAEALQAALRLWRGPALADVLYEPFAQHEAERLEERRLIAMEARIDADVALGRDSELVPELEALVREHPQRERLLGQLMLALYRAGRQTEALTAFGSARQRLAEELGLEPASQLAELQRRILAHDPGLRAAPNKAAAGGTQRMARKPLAIALGIGAVAASVALGIVLGTRETTASNGNQASPGLVAVSSDGGTPALNVALASAPAAIAVGEGSLWLANPTDGAVSRVGLAANSVVDRIPVGGTPGAVAVGGGSVWVASVPGESVKRIDPGSGTVTQTVPLGGARAVALTFGGSDLWVADATDDSLIAVDPGSGVVKRTFHLDIQPTVLAIADAAIWVGDYGSNSIIEVDLRTGQTIVTVHVGNGPSALAVGAGAVWVANRRGSTVSRIDPDTGNVDATIPVGSGPASIAFSRGFIWVANEYSATVSQIDPDRNVVVGSVSVGGAPTALAAARETVWVGLRQLAQHRGGTLVLLHTRATPIDPALNQDLLPPVSDGLTRDGLLTYNHVSGAAGIELVPDLALDVPLPTEGGTTYTFRLRPGIPYSDGRPVRAGDFRRAIERLFRLGSYGRPLFAGIRGADRCDEAHCDLSQGIVTNESTRTVTFHLRASDPNFLNSLALGGLASAVPVGTPFHDVGLKPIPGTGPYEIASVSKSGIRFVRNPLFREWSHAAQPNGNPDQIDLRFGLSPGDEARAIAEGRADWMAENPPATLLPTLKRRFRSQLHSWPSTVTEFFQFNTTTAPFDDIRVRRALNFAVDRQTLARFFGGPEAATPTCQVLPPGTSGYHRYCPYTRQPGPAGQWIAPDLRRARRLVAVSGTRGTPITVWGWTDDAALRPPLIDYVAGVLRRLGYPTHIHLVTHDSLANPPPSVFAKIQIIPTEWGDTSYGFFATWFSCSGGSSHGWFCDHRTDQQNLRAQASDPTRPELAASLWKQVDRGLVDRAASVPLANRRAIDFVSARVRNYQVSPYWGLIADQLWLR